MNLSRAGIATTNFVPRIPFILILLLNCIYLVNAQVPGYVGKKNIIHGDVYFMPALPDKYNRPRTYSGNSGFYFNAHQGGGYERVVSRRHVVGADADLFRFGNPDAELDGHVGRTRAKGTSFGLHFKAFPFIRKGWLAPLGPYFGMDYKLIWVKSEFISTTGSQLPRPYEKHRGGSLGIQLGYSAILFKKLLLDYGARIGITDLRGILYGNSLVFEDAVILQNTDLLKLHLGLGFLF